MNCSAREILETAALILISTLLFVAFFHVNGWVFAGIEYRQGVNWIFLPAGFRVLLVLTMGIMLARGTLAVQALRQDRPRSSCSTAQFSVLPPG